MGDIKEDIYNQNSVVVPYLYGLKDDATKEETMPAVITKKTKVTAPTTITVKSLEEEFNLDGKTLRVIIRSLGLRAPKIDNPTNKLGPTHKYQWTEGDKQLKKVRDAIENYIDEAGEVD